MIEIDRSFGTFGTGKYNFGYVPDPPEPPDDKWFENHCPKCVHNHEWKENGKWHSECLEGGCTGYVERNCTDEYIEGFCEDCDHFEQCKQVWKGDAE